MNITGDYYYDYLKSFIRSIKFLLKIPTVSFSTVSLKTRHLLCILSDIFHPDGLADIPSVCNCKHQLHKWTGWDI